MIYISHRGNLNGPDPSMENNPEQIIKCIKEGFDVEIDVWFLEGWYLGHDEPQYKVDMEFLNTKGLWCHAKNIEALLQLRNYNINCFWHQEDDVTLTSSGFLWTFPGKKLTEMSICVMPEIHRPDLSSCAGICTDYPIKYSKEIK